MKSALAFSAILGSAFLGLAAGPWPLVLAAAVILVAVSFSESRVLLSPSARLGALNIWANYAASEAGHALIATGSAFAMGTLVRIMAFG